MKTVDEWKAMLRTRLREALRAREKHVAAVVRETLAAIDNAEAPAASGSPAPSEHAAFAGSVAGLGAAEVDRLVLTPADVAALVQREIRERREAADTYVQLGRHEEAEVLAGQIQVLVELQG